MGRMKVIGRGPNKAKPIRDTRTGTEYPSMYQAGKALAASFQLDPKNQLVWYKIVPRARGRFQTRNAHGDWVDLDDPSVEGFTPIVD
jgi:hypothetical protein